MSINFIFGLILAMVIGTIISYLAALMLVISWFRDHHYF